jgi:transcriptional regulator GlxA family with amidase domain
VLSRIPEGSDYRPDPKSRTQLERTDGGLKQVASAAGFGSVDVMRRAFVRLLGITPRRYRELAEHQ